MDRLSYPSFRLIYYDQRGRGRSAKNVEPETVSIASEVEDLEHLRRYFRLDFLALLGHSWGCLLALEYAIRHPDRVSHLILMNTAPVSHDDWILFEQEMQKKPHAQELEALERSPNYEAGDPETVTYANRLFFSTTVREPKNLERLVKNMTHGLTKEAVLKVRRIARQLWNETLDFNGYDLTPKLKQISVPTLVIHGDYDFVPQVCASHIADAIPGARFVVLKETGHFAYIESMDEVRKEISKFIGTR